MEKYLLENFINGWFIGNFQPTILDTEKFEVAVKKYRKGDSEEIHHHKIANEYSIIISGLFKMNDEVCKEGDIFLVKPNEPIHFFCLEDGITLVIKVPSVKGDKYID